MLLFRLNQKLMTVLGWRQVCFAEIEFLNKQPGFQMTSPMTSLKVHPLMKRARLRRSFVPVLYPFLIENVLDHIYCVCLSIREEFSEWFNEIKNSWNLIRFKTLNWLTDPFSFPCEQVDSFTLSCEKWSRFSIFSDSTLRVSGLAVPMHCFDINMIGNMFQKSVEPKLCCGNLIPFERIH